MMVQRPVNDVINQGESLENFRAAGHVALHLRIFLIIKTPRLIENRIRNSDFSNIMQPGGFLKVPALLLAEPQFLADLIGIDGDTQ